MIIAGLSAVGIGYTSYAANIWDGEVLSGYSKAGAELNDANTTYLESAVRGDTLSDAEFGKLTKDHREQIAQVDTLNQAAETADKTSDRFLLYSMFYSIILFFTSLASLASRTNAKLVLVGVTFGVFILTTIGVALLRLPA